MKQTVPEEVLAAPDHSLVIVASDETVDFYIREDEFTAARYPARSNAEYALHHWDNDRVIAIALVVRIGDANFGTFERWLNASDRTDLRILQLLAKQKMLDGYLVSDQVTKTFRTRNNMAGAAAGLVATLRVRAAWSDEEFDEWRKRLDMLYPTPDALWRGARESRR